LKAKEFPPVDDTEEHQWSHWPRCVATATVIIRPRRDGGDTSCAVDEERDFRLWRRTAAETSTTARRWLHWRPAPQPDDSQSCRRRQPCRYVMWAYVLFSHSLIRLFIYSHTRDDTGTVTEMQKQTLNHSQLALVLFF